MAWPKYQLLSSNGDTSPEEEKSITGIPSSIKTRVVPCLLVLSILINAILAMEFFSPFSRPECLERSEYAGLVRDKPVPWIDDVPTASHNRTVLDEAWSTINGDLGTVALTDEFVAAHNLPRAQRWPWDPSKGIYLLQSHHNLHCLKMIRTWVMDAYDKKEPRMHFRHIMHCVDAIREDIVCNADDTPRYTGFIEPDADPSSGQGQSRMCRDWEKLEAWAIENSACYDSHQPEDGEKTNVKMLMHCPDGSRPWEYIPN